MRSGSAGDAATQRPTRLPAEIRANSSRKYSMRFVGILVIVWLVVGAIAAGQRGYFTHAHKTVPAPERSR